MANQSDETRLRAEGKFKKKELQTQEADKVWAEHAAAGRAADANRAKLRAQRLAKEEADKVGEAETKLVNARRSRSQADESSTGFAPCNVRNVLCDAVHKPGP
jgi:hypothetical protein